MKKIFLILNSILCIALGAELTAQTTETIYAIGDASSVTLEHVEKIIDPATTKDTLLSAPSFKYNLQPKRFNTSVKVDKITAAKIGSDPLTKLFRTYARFGVGNYSTLMGEFDLGSLRSKSSAWGVHSKHFSAGSGPDQVAGFGGFSQQNLDVFGKYFFKRHTLLGNFGYDRDAIYNYGSTLESIQIDKPSAKQTFNYFSANANLLSHYTDSSAVNHQVNLRYYYLTDHFKTNEDNILLNVNAGRFIRTERIDALLSLDYNRNSSENDTVVNTIFKLQPMFSANGKKFQAAIGVNLNVNIDELTETYFFPQANFSYNILNHIIIPYISLKGGLQRNSFRTLTLDNPFLLSASSFALRNTQRKYELMAGLRGSLSSEIAYDAHFSRVDLVDAPFFLNSTLSEDSLGNKFSIVYDNVNVVNIHCQISWYHFEKIHVTATGDFNQFTMANEAKPWHTPTLRLSLLGKYNLKDKIIAHAEVYYLNGQYAKVWENNEVVIKNMKGLVDVNLGLEYRYTKFLSAFLNLNNLAAQRYQRWYAYPTQKFNLLGGLTYTF